MYLKTIDIIYFGFCCIISTTFSLKIAKHADTIAQLPACRFMRLWPAPFEPASACSTRITPRPSSGYYGHVDSHLKMCLPAIRCAVLFCSVLLLFLFCFVLVFGFGVFDCGYVCGFTCPTPTLLPAQGLWSNRAQHFP